MSLAEDTFISHLVELRDRLLRSLIAVVVAFALLGFWPTYGVIYDFLALPLIKTLPAGSKMIATGVITPFLIPLKVGLMGGFLLVLPYVLYQAWAFVAPGLYSHEKKLVLPLVALAVVGSTLVSYTRAKGDALGIDASVGYMQRHERAGSRHVVDLLKERFEVFVADRFHHLDRHDLVEVRPGFQRPGLGHAVDLAEPFEHRGVSLQEQHHLLSKSGQARVEQFS